MDLFDKNLVKISNCKISVYLKSIYAIEDVRLFIDESSYALVFTVSRIL